MHLNYPWKRAMFVNILSPDFTLSRLKPSFFLLLLLLPLETIILREKKSSIVFIPRKFTPPKNQIFFLTNFKLWFFLSKNRPIINFMDNLINYPVHSSQNTQKKFIKFFKSISETFLFDFVTNFSQLREQRREYANSSPLRSNNNKIDTISLFSNIRINYRVFAIPFERNKDGGKGGEGKEGSRT